MRAELYASMSPYVYPFYILIRPVDGYQELKNNNKYSLKLANWVLFLWFFSHILSAGYMDFDFNPKVIHPDGLRVPLIFMSTIGLFTLAVISNWCFCTLMDGKGTIRNIWIVCAYALLPYVIVRFIAVFLSHLLVLDEAIFVTYLLWIGIIWSVFLLVVALSVVHEYDMRKTLASIFLTICGIAIILFLLILISGIYNQIYSFIMTVYSEIKFRLR